MDRKTIVYFVIDVLKFIKNFLEILDRHVKKKSLCILGIIIVYRQNKLKTCPLNYSIHTLRILR